MRKGLIALDADGVLLNYNEAYANAWARAFGQRPALKDAQGYFPHDRWDAPMLGPDGRDALRQAMQEDFWSTMPAIDGALQACRLLADAGYELVCVSAVKQQFHAGRLANLQRLGFGIQRLYATPSDGKGATVSPKAAAIHELMPDAFVDDYAPYMRGMPPTVHAALILREPNGSPNVGDNLTMAHSTHADLAAFAQWWTQERLPSQALADVRPLVR
jgi:phosphoglycolate phosphatase-like HAD superfamily hydrolase